MPNVEPMSIPRRRSRTASGAAPRSGPADDRSPGAKRAPALATDGRADPKPDVVVTVSKSVVGADASTDAAGHVLLYAPVTTGSEHDPLPIGEWKVNGVQLNPTFHYNPDLFWDADPTHTKARSRRAEQSRRPGLDRHLEASTTAFTARPNRRRSAGPNRTAASG